MLHTTIAQHLKCEVIGQVQEVQHQALVHNPIPEELHVQEDLQNNDHQELTEEEMIALAIQLSLEDAPAPFHNAIPQVNAVQQGPVPAIQLEPQNNGWDLTRLLMLACGASVLLLGIYGLKISIPESLQSKIMDALHILPTDKSIG